MEAGDLERVRWVARDCREMSVSGESRARLKRSGLVEYPFGGGEKYYWYEGYLEPQ